MFTCLEKLYNKVNSNVNYYKITNLSKIISMSKKTIVISSLFLFVGLAGFFLSTEKVLAGENCWGYYDYSTSNVPAECTNALASKTDYQNPYSCTAQPFPEDLKMAACPDGGVFPSIAGYYCHDKRRSCYPGYYKPAGSFYCVNSSTAGTVGFLVGSNLGCDNKAEIIYRDRPQYSPTGYAPNLYCCAFLKTPANTALGQGFFSRFKNLFSSFGKKVENVFTGETKSVEVKKVIKPGSTESVSKTPNDNKSVEKTVRVYTKENAWGKPHDSRQLLNTGIVLREGDTLIVSVDPNQKWNIGPDDQHACSADGCSAFGETNLGSGVDPGFTYGSLVGYLDGGFINGQGFFQIGTNFKQLVGKRLSSGNGKLYLMSWDDAPSDNSGYLDVSITVTRANNKPKIDAQNQVVTPKSTNSDKKLKSNKVESDQKSVIEKSTEFEQYRELINNSQKQLEQMKNLQINGVSGVPNNTSLGKITDDLYLELIVRATTEAQKDPNGYILTMRTVYAKYGITEIDLANYSKELMKDPARAQAIMAKYSQATSKLQ
jgi:hypothetical protein